MDKKIEELLGGSEYIRLKEERFRYYKYISDLQQSIHSQIPKEDYNTSVVPVPTDFREENFKGTNHRRAVIYLMSNGCEWALKDGHGCTMCGHLARQTRRLEIIAPEEYYRQFVSEFKKVDFNKSPLLNLYNNGSFLNDNEMPPQARRKILKLIGGEPNIKMLVLETRPEFVTEEKVSEIKCILPDKHVDLAVGLEMKDDFLRTVCINKGFSLKQYKRAAEIITRYLNLRTYVLLKPPFLSEREAVENAIETVRYAFAGGSRLVSLEACSIQDYTLVKHLSDRGLYHTPWLWSILEVVKTCSHLGRLVIGLFQFFPSPKEMPYNCDRCSHDVMDRIHNYNRTLDVGLFDSLTCECKEEWKREIEKTQLPFGERLTHILHQLNGGVTDGKEGNDNK